MRKYNMRYNEGDYVVLRDDLIEGEYYGVKRFYRIEDDPNRVGATIDSVFIESPVYLTSQDDIITDEMIDHEKTRRARGELDVDDEQDGHILNRVANWIRDSMPIRETSDRVESTEQSELTMLPEAVRKWMDEAKIHLTLDQVAEIVFGFMSSHHEEYLCEQEEWIRDNFEEFVKAWLEEDKKTKPKQDKKYRVKLLPSHKGYLNTDELLIFTSTAEQSDEFQTEFTEQEIKDINPLYWLFKEEVEQ